MWPLSLSQCRSLCCDICVRAHSDVACVSRQLLRYLHIHMYIHTYMCVQHTHARLPSAMPRRKSSGRATLKACGACPCSPKLVRGRAMSGHPHGDGRGYWLRSCSMPTVLLIHTLTRMHACVHIDTHTHTHTHIRTHTHTHT